MSGVKCSAQLLDRRLVEDAEVVLERDDVPRVVERVQRMAAVGVPDRGVHDVEREDREDLDPPVDVAAVAEAARRPSSRLRSVSVLTTLEPDGPLGVVDVARLRAAADRDDRRAEHAHDHE